MESGEAFEWLVQHLAVGLEVWQRDAEGGLAPLKLASPGQLLRNQSRVRHREGEWRLLDVVTVNRMHEPSVQAVATDLPRHHRAAQDGGGPAQRPSRLKVLFISGYATAPWCTTRSWSRARATCRSRSP